MKNSEEFENLYNQTQNMLSKGISKILRSIDTKENRVKGLLLMEDKITIDVIKRINSIATTEEDYETCEAIQEYLNIKNLTLN